VVLFEGFVWLVLLLRIIPGLCGWFGLCLSGQKSWALLLVNGDEIAGFVIGLWCRMHDSRGWKERMFVIGSCSNGVVCYGI